MSLTLLYETTKKRKNKTYIPVAVYFSLSHFQVFFFFQNVMKIVSPSKRKKYDKNKFESKKNIHIGLKATSSFNHQY